MHSQEMLDLKFTYHFETFSAQSHFLGCDKGGGGRSVKVWNEGEGVKNIDFLSDILFEWPIRDVQKLINAQINKRTIDQLTDKGMKSNSVCLGFRISIWIGFE